LLVAPDLIRRPASSSRQENAAGSRIKSGMTVRETGNRFGFAPKHQASGRIVLREANGRCSPSMSHEPIVLSYTDVAA